jgi:hypothetical protein
MENKDYFIGIRCGTVVIEIANILIEKIHFLFSRSLKIGNGSHEMLHNFSIYSETTYF